MNINQFSDLFSLCPPPPLQSRCHCIVNHCKNMTRKLLKDPTLQIFFMLREQKTFVVTYSTFVHIDEQLKKSKVGFNIAEDSFTRENFQKILVLLYNEI